MLTIHRLVHICLPALTSDRFHHDAKQSIVDFLYNSPANPSFLAALPLLLFGGCFFANW